MDSNILNATAYVCFHSSETWFYQRVCCQVRHVEGAEPINQHIVEGQKNRSCFRRHSGLIKCWCSSCWSNKPEGQTGQRSKQRGDDAVLHHFCFLVTAATAWMQQLFLINSSPPFSHVNQLSATPSEPGLRFWSSATFSCSFRFFLSICFFFLSFFHLNFVGLFFFFQGPPVPPGCSDWRDSLSVFGQSEPGDGEESQWDAEGDGGCEGWDKDAAKGKKLGLMEPVRTIQMFLFCLRWFSIRTVIFLFVVYDFYNLATSSDFVPYYLFTNQNIRLIQLMVAVTFGIC